MAQELKALGKITVPSRSSYFGILDLAGFKKDRFFLYQARWRPDLRDGAPPAPLELAGSRRPGHAGVSSTLRATRRSFSSTAGRSAGRSWSRCSIGSAGMT
jgi:hypothetical protein